MHPRPSVAWSLATLAALAAAGVAASSIPRHAPRPLPRPAPAAGDAAPAALARAVAEDTPLPVTLSAAASAAPTSDPAQTWVVSGPMEQVLYADPGRSPVSPELVRQALGLFAHKLDLTRDLALGDRVRLVVRRSAGGDGAGVLDYAELERPEGAVRLYRRSAGAGFSVGDFVDEDGVGLDRLLLRTPLAILRPTSGFGPRRHPLLGYSRMHQGVDFAAAVGTPVLAAGEGVVEAAGWAGDYGRRVRLRHGSGLETLYAHLSRWAPGVQPGAAVRQGQVIGWTGASGLATGPHLHFEVIREGRAVDPASARPPPAPMDPGRRLVFEAQRRAVDALLATDGPARG